LPSSIHVAALTDVGRVRTNNEDAFDFDPDLSLYVVCDGMGGMAAGEVASKMACDTVIDIFAAQSPATPLDARLSAAIHEANTAVFEAGRQAGQHGMGTTLVAAVIAGTKLLIGNVGDSRAYLLSDDFDSYGRQGMWRQLTSDHSYINELIRQGSITEETSHTPELQRFGSVITRAIGASEHVEPDLFPLDLRYGDTVLLATDGLTRHLDTVRFAELIDPGDLEGSCRRLVDDANASGGNDNITCMLIHYGD
jgi:protein phosphatase